MTSVLLISHGTLAEAMISTVEMIIGEQYCRLFALMLHENEASDSFKSRLEVRLQSMLEVGETIVLSDLILGTPFNAAAMLMEKYSFYHITGMNISLLLFILTEINKQKNAAEACRIAFKEANKQWRIQMGGGN